MVRRRLLAGIVWTARLALLALLWYAALVLGAVILAWLHVPGG